MSEDRKGESKKGKGREEKQVVGGSKGKKVRKEREGRKQSCRRKWNGKR